MEELYVKNVKGKKTVIDKNGKAVAEYTVDKDGNILDESGKKVVDAGKVKNLPAKDKADSTEKKDKNTKDDGEAAKTPSTDAKDTTEKYEDTGESGSTTPAPESKPDPQPDSQPQPQPQPQPEPEPEKPAPHTHDWKPVYRTEVIEAFEYHGYCCDCGMIFPDDWGNDEIRAHSSAELDNGKSGRWATGNVKVGEHEVQVLIGYECSCGEKKAR